jgi:endo-1,4-beta-xylanase
MQSHHHLNTDPATVEQSIQLFESLGVEIAISELDIRVVASGAGGLSKEEATKQAQVYAQLFDIFKNHAANISRVTFWGIDDANSWLNKNNSYGWACLFDAALNAKPAFYAVQ